MLIKSQSIEAIYFLLLSLFIVLTNETDGMDSISGKDTPCETHKQRIISVNATGLMDDETTLEKILDPENEEDIYVPWRRS